MKNLLLLRYGEIHLKGKNRRYFENVLLSNIKGQQKIFLVRFKQLMGDIWLKIMSHAMKRN